MYDDLIDGVYRACLLMAEYGDNEFKGTHGNVSYLDRSSDILAIKPSGMPYDGIYKEDIPLVYLESFEVINKDTAKYPSVDLLQHVAIYKNNPQITAICHAHSPYITAFCANGAGIPVYLTEFADIWGMPVRCDVYQDLYAWGNNLYFAKGEKAVLLEHHGSVVVGKEPEEVVNLTVKLESTAYKAYLARMLGTAFLRLPEPLNAMEVQKWHARYVGSYGQK